MEGVPRHGQNPVTECSQQRLEPSRNLNQSIATKQKSKPKHCDRIVLCIGGRIFQTSKQTLCVDSHSMLAAWVLRHLRDEGTGLLVCRKGDLKCRNADADEGEEEDRDGYDDGHVLWIDRDAHRFDHVLNYLRNGTIWLEDVASLRAVQEEAVFFGLSGLESLCEERIQALEDLKRQHAEEVRKAIHNAVIDFCKSHVPYASSLSFNGSKGEVLAILRGRRLGVSGASEDPIFQMDEDF